MTKLQEFHGRFSITIPNNFIDKKKWVKGQELITSFNERGNIEIMDTK